MVFTPVLYSSFSTWRDRERAENGALGNLHKEDAVKLMKLVVDLTRDGIEPTGREGERCKGRESWLKSHFKDKIVGGDHHFQAKVCL